jgi:hypothetical protein
MSDGGQRFAIRWSPLHHSWHVYEVIDSASGPCTKVVRDEWGVGPRNFNDEERARSYIEAIPDATEVEYPA